MLAVLQKRHRSCHVSGGENGHTRHGSLFHTLCREKMPASKFLVQTDSSVFDELVRASSLPCFTTDYGRLQGGYPGRVHIPLTDAEAHVTFYLAAGKGLRL